MNTPVTSILYRNYFKDKDALSQRKLFELSFPEAVGTLVNSDQHYRWKFESFPNSIHSYEYVAAEPGDITDDLVSYYAAIPFVYKIGFNKIQLTCGMVCDVMTHPDRRGKGIFTKIGKFATDNLKTKGVAFTTGYPIRPEVIPGHLRAGWKIVQVMPMYSRPLGIGSFLPTPIKFLSKILNPILRACQFWTHLPAIGYETETLACEEFFKLKDYNKFLEKWISEQKNALIKSIEFLRWRTGAPGAQYHFIALKYNGILVGFSLVRPTILKNVETLAILDISVLKEHFKGSRKIHQAIKKLAVDLNKDVVVCMTSSQWAKKYRLFSSFYISTSAVFSLIVKKLDENLLDEDLFTTDPWHLFWIDSDDL